MAIETCRDFLTIPDLKKICEHRGWSPIGQSKDELVTFVAPRLAGPEGVERAMATLGERGLFLLYRFALSPGSVTVDDLTDEERRRSKRWGLKHRTVFKDVATHLLNRGVALVHKETSVYSISRESRFERLGFVVPKDHLPLIPPLPIETEPLSPDASRLDMEAFCKEALGLAIERAGAKDPRWPEGLLGRLAADISLDKHAISLPRKARLSDADDLFNHLLHLWLGASNKLSKASAKIAAHILSHLPEGHGCSSKTLAEAVTKLGGKMAVSEAKSFCSDGHLAGLLTKKKVGSAYAMIAGDHTGGEAAEPRLAIESVDGGEKLEVDLSASDLGPALELAAYSQVEPVGGRLRLSPSIVQLGRAWDRLAELEVIQRAREACPAYDSALRQIGERQGKTVLHQGLAVLRIDDLGLRTLLAHRLGDKARTLSGPYLAIPSGALDQAVKIIEKEGFAPRRVTA